MQKYWGTFLVILLIASCKSEEKGEDMALEPEIDKVEEVEPADLYGFNPEEYLVVHDTVKYGDSFGELMLANHVDYPKIATVSDAYRDTFDVRKIQVGKPYTILKSKDTLQAAQVFIYENDAINYTVVDLRDSVKAYKDRKDVRFVEKEAAGVIPPGGSLSLSIDESGLDYMLTLELADIYAWTIDFFKLDPGDKFKIVFDEKYINDSIYAGIGNIKAAYFEHQGEGFYAFPYEDDSLGVIDYYDHEANNLRRTFLRAPLKFGRMSSRYNLKRRIRYYGYRVRPHRGTDYAAPVGTPILATADGVVTESTRKRGNGKYVKIRHNGTYSTQYLHMRAQKVKRGDFVKQGEVIGWIGMTGNTAGPHVCYRFWKNGRQVDPLREELPQAEPLAEALRPDFFDYIDPVKKQLDCIAFPTTGQQDLLTLNE